MSVINIKLTDTPDPAPSGRRGIYINLAGQGRMVDSAGNTYAIAGTNGWSPIFGLVTDGERRVLQLVDWTGGEGTKPGTGQYIGPTGLVATAAEAVDLRGATGAAGADGTNGADGTDGREVELRVDGTNLQWRYVGDVSWITLIDLSTIGGSSSYPAATFRESNTVLFDGDYITGVNAAPRTGNILFDFTGAKLGAVTIMYHQDASAFTFPTEAELNFDSGTDISTTKVNKFMMVLVDDTPSAEKVDVMVNWEGGTP